MKPIPLLIVAVLIATGGRVWAQEPAAQAVQVQAPTVTVAAAEMAELATRAVVSGTLVPRQEVQVYPRVAGQEVVELLADIGDSVAQGDVLARLDAATLTAQLDQARASLASAEAGIAQAEGQLVSAQASARQADQALDRTQTLNRRGDAAQATLDQAIAAADTAKAAVRSAEAALSAARAQKQQAQAALEVAQLNADWAEIRSPVSGVVLARNAIRGGLTALGGEPLFRIVAGGLVEVEAEIIETDLAEVGAGDPAVIDVAGRPALTGRVRLVSPRVDPLTRLGTIRIAIDDLGAVRTGMFARAVVTTDVRTVLTVPPSAVLSDGAGSYVQLVRDGVVERREVTAGALSGDRREIARGLEPGDEVIVRAGAFFREGDRVRPVAAGAGDPTAAASGQ